MVALDGHQATGIRSRTSFRLADIHIAALILILSGAVGACGLGSLVSLAFGALSTPVWAALVGSYALLGAGITATMFVGAASNPA